jgi:hypothetical protein
LIGTYADFGNTKKKCVCHLLATFKAKGQSKKAPSRARVGIIRKGQAWQPDGEECIVRVGKLSLNIHMLNALLCVLGGTLGSSVSALISAADRIARGWEFKDGTKYPKEDPKDKFGARMVPWFIVRPFLGSAMGLLVYVGMKGGYLIAVRNASQGDFSREGLLFLAFLGGLGFAKQKRSN